jgi:hypothetical protein
MGEANGCAFHARFLAQNLGGLLSALAGVGRMLEFFACIFSANPEILKESSPFDA